MMINELKITEVSIFPIRPQNGLVGFCSCTFAGCLSLNSIAIYTRPDGSGYRLVYPSKILPHGKEIQLFYPISKNASEIFNSAILQEFENLMKKSRESEPENEHEHP